MLPFAGHALGRERDDFVQTSACFEFVCQQTWQTERGQQAVKGMTLRPPLQHRSIARATRKRSAIGTQNTSPARSEYLLW
jgi:hypothetical protein